MYLKKRLMAPVRQSPIALKGASLIEVLVSIVIASVGLLALAGVNAASMRYTKMSQYRATATQLANDMGERMRANKGVPDDPATAGVNESTGFFAGNYDFDSVYAEFDNQATKATLPTQLCNTSASNCTPAQIAALDLAQWRILVRDQLPEGSAFMKPHSVSAVRIAMDVWVVWRDPAVADADDSPALSTECPSGLSRNSDLSIRCSYFRINI
jgi:type IV pilus assembly protein PilV